jgi:hypothetical protein
MKPSESKVVNTLAWIILIIFALLPFHAFITVWLSSLAGHYTMLRLWKEVLLVVLCAGSIFILAKDKKLLKSLASLLLVRLIAIYCSLTILWGAAAYASNKVTLKSLGFGLVVNLRFLIFFVVVWIVAAKSPLLKQLWLKVLLIPAGIVVSIGLLQRTLLPYDFLKHFGYNSSTIYPYETINHNVKYPRVMSTLRGANPLGAYMVLVMTAIYALLIKSKQRRVQLSIFAAAGILVLIFSYSRAAWIGTLLSVSVLAVVSIGGSKMQRLLLPILGLVVLACVAAGILLRHNLAFENIFFHTQEYSSIQATSDQGHINALKDGVRDVVHEPLGRGVGTAGPASVYNNNNVRIAENYYLQIAQETGWAGLILFIAINYLVACELWIRREGMLARILLASLVGITFVNLLSHAWTDDTLAYIWWGLAGVAIAPIITDRQKAHGKKIKAKS